MLFRSVIQLLDKYSFYKQSKLFISLNNLILLFLKFSSTNDFNPLIFSISSIKLLLRLSTLNDCNLANPSIFYILFSCKSKISRFLKLSRFLIEVIWFLLSINTRRFSTVEKFEISLNLFLEKSRKVRLGKLTKFSILIISLFYKFKYFILSSPSSKGTCFKFLLSNVIFSTFVSLSQGLLYTIRMFGIYGSSTQRVRVSYSTF